MTDHAQTRFWSGIDIPKTLAGTLAAVSAAVCGSYLGIAGTLIGAAVVSLISSIGTELYHRSIDRGAKKLQSAFVAAPAAVGTPEVAAAHEPPSSTDDHPKKQLRWKRVGMVAAALFVLGLGTLTAIELVAGRSAADALSGRGGDSPPSLFNTSNTSDSGDDAEQTDSGEPSAPATEPTGESTTEPTDPPASPAPAEEPQTTTEPQPEPEATTAPEENETGTEGPAPEQQPAQQEEGF
jgi:hypothetical protein